MPAQLKSARPVLESRNEALRLVFASNLRQRMIEKRMSQSDLARAVWQESRTDSRGYEQPMGKDRISAYYNGRVMPTSVNLNKIAKALDMTPEKMLFDEGVYVEAAAAIVQKPDIMVFRPDETDPMILHVEIKLSMSRDTAHEIMALIAKGSTKTE